MKPSPINATRMGRKLIWLLVLVVPAACGTNDPVPTSTLESTTNAAVTTQTSTAQAPTTHIEPQVTTTSSTHPQPAAETTLTVETEEEEAESVSHPDEQPRIEGLGARASEQVWATASKVEDIRGLKFDGLPSITVLSPEDFEARVRLETESQLERVEIDEALYKLLGLLEPEDDLAALYAELYGEGVVGFYSSENKEMVLPRAGEEFSLLETMTLFHELVHALTDQHFGFGQKMDTLNDSQRYDRGMGLLSLVEGDASLSEVLFVQSLSAEESSQLMREFAQMELPDFSVPLFMEQALYFPYQRGFDYVWNAWEDGGWQAVKDLYIDPPLSTEEIFLGEAQSHTHPIQLERPHGMWPDGYEEIYDYTWGFLDILLMFEQVLDYEVAVDAARGWGGSRSLVAYHPEGEIAFVWEYVGDSPGETDELARLLFDYAYQGMDVGMPMRHDEPPAFSGSAGDYVFVDRIDNRMVMVACSDPQVCPSVIGPYWARP